MDVYFAMDFLVFIVFCLDTPVLIVSYRDFLCCLVCWPQGCNKLELSWQHGRNNGQEWKYVLWLSLAICVQTSYWHYVAL